MEQIEIKQLTRKIRRRYFEYFNILFSSHLINLIVLFSLSKPMKERWCLNTRDLIILISASMLISNSRSVYFSSTKLKLIFKEIFYPQEVHRSLKKLNDSGLIFRSKRNMYLITSDGKRVMRSYAQQFNNEFKRLKRYLSIDDNGFVSR